MEVDQLFMVQNNNLRVRVKELEEKVDTRDAKIAEHLN
jgi:hypothetical protein